MKKLLYFFLSCVLLCGALMLSGCKVNIKFSNDEGTEAQISGEITQEEIEKISLINKNH